MLYLILLTILFMVIIPCYIFYIVEENKLEIEKIKIFPDYMGVLTYHFDKAFEIIYKEKIFIYSVEATKPNEEQYSSISREFVVLILKMLGPKLKKSYIKIYGNEETFIFNILDYFSAKYENDEVRGEALNNLTEKDIEMT